VPATLCARPARADDYTVFTGFFAALGVPDPTPTCERYAREIMPHAILLEDTGGATDPGRASNAAERDPAALGYAFFMPIGTLGRVMHVVVDAAARGRGVGRVLMGEIAARLRAQGATRWMLNVKPDNLPAIRLYQRVGLAVVAEGWSMNVTWDCLERLPHDARGAVARALAQDGSEDRTVETALNLPSGTLALGRSREGRVLLRLDDPTAAHEDPLGAAIFDPAFPGASPFRVRTPDLARALLAGIRLHARPEHDSVAVHVEGDPALAKALTDAGATTRLRMLRMEGSLD
jgi:GNAT superfamily N-acetyltransferase